MMIEHIYQMKDLKKNILRRQVHYAYIPQICLQMKKLKRKIKASKLNSQMILEISIQKNMNEFIWYNFLQTPLWIHSIISPSKNWIENVICPKFSLIYNLVNKNCLPSRSSTSSSTSSTSSSSSSSCSSASVAKN